MRSRQRCCVVLCGNFFFVCPCTVYHCHCSLRSVWPSSISPEFEVRVVFFFKFLYLLSVLIVTCFCVFLSTLHWYKFQLCVFRALYAGIYCVVDLRSVLFFIFFLFLGLYHFSAVFSIPRLSSIVLYRIGWHSNRLSFDRICAAYVWGILYVNSSLRILTVLFGGAFCIL